jgi:adenylate cyclase class 2
MAKEVEIKIRLESAEAGRKLLRNSGFEEHCPRTLETNDLFDTAGQSLRSSRKLLRLRTYGDRHILTYKGPPEPGRFKVREEVEVEVGDAGSLRKILERLSFRRTFRYEKFRTEYRRPGEAGHVMLDETPIGVYLELEGDPHWIDGVARELGFGEACYVRDSYGTLYERHREIHGGDPEAMVFPREDQRQ